MNGEIKLKKKRIFSSICYGENKKSQILFIIDGILINAAAILTSGVFLSGYIVYLKGSDFLVGLLNNSGTWASVISVFSFLIFERMRKRKKLLLLLNLVSRIIICSIIFLPLISSNKDFILTTASFMVITGNILWGFYSIGITVMMIGVLPKDYRNQYIYIRVFWLRISFTLTTIIMGFLLDFFNKSYTGFLVVYLTSLIFSIADVLILAYVDEPEYNSDSNLKAEPNMFFEPVKDKRYRNFLAFIFLFYLSLTISTSFTPLYLIKYLKLDYSFISGINVITYILLIICTRFWSNVERNRGLQFVIKITALFAIGEVFIYSFLTNKTYYLLFLAPIFSGIGYSGFNIAILTYRYELIPESFKTIYEGWFNAVLGISMLISPILGNFLMKNLPVINNSLFKNSSFQLLYIISSICSLVVVYLMFYRNNDLKKHVINENRNINLNV